jgi:hypothetical protein
MQSGDVFAKHGTGRSRGTAEETTLTQGLIHIGSILNGF